MQAGKCSEPLKIQNLQEQDHSSLSLDNRLTHCNNNIRSCLKGRDATIISTLLHVKNTNTVSRDNQLIYIMNVVFYVEMYLFCNRGGHIVNSELVRVLC